MKEYKTNTLRHLMLIDRSYFSLIDKERILNFKVSDECSKQVQVQRFDDIKSFFGGAGSSSEKKQSRGAIAVLSINGAIDYKPGFVEMFFGAVDINRIEEAFTDLVNDETVDTIILDIDSPGGSVIGVRQLSETIYKAREKKRIVSLANPLSASAAYWIGTAAHEMYSIPDGIVGSVGAFMLHFDYSQYLANEGIKPTFIYAGDKKVKGNELEPLDAETRDEMQEKVDAVYKEFVTDLARNRGVSTATITSQYGQGAGVDAKTALKDGMIDGILTFKDLLIREMKAMAGKSGGNRAKAAYNNALMTLEIEELNNG